MADYYERFVKEYLEVKGFIVRLNTKFKKERGYGDIDIIAINSDKDEIVVGEVKGEGLSKKDIDKEDEDFNNTFQRNMVKGILGHENYQKTIFCWGVDEETKRYAREKYAINIVQFWEIINYLISEVREIRRQKRWRYDDYSNLMLLQMLYHFSKEYKGKIRVNLTQLKKR